MFVRHCVLLGSVRSNLDKKEPPPGVTHCQDASLHWPLKDRSLLTSHRSCNDDVRTHLFAKVQGENMAVLRTDS